MARREFSESSDRILATEPVEVRRYATHTRINHWFTAILIILLILSGFALFTVLYLSMAMALVLLARTPLRLLRTFQAFFFLVLLRMAAKAI